MTANFLAGAGETNCQTQRDLDLKINSLLDVDKESWALTSVPSVGKCWPEFPNVPGAMLEELTHPAPAARRNMWTGLELLGTE